LPLEERREYLRIIRQTYDKRERARARIQFSDSVVGNGPTVFAEAEKLGVEGIVSNRRDSRYRSGRTDRWRKIKCWANSDFVVVGTAIDKASGPLLARGRRYRLLRLADPEYQVGALTVLALFKWLIGHPLPLWRRFDRGLNPRIARLRF
jgi:hypothetical protein